MKKNFMAIASLLIAAMLLVVSCAPEAKVEGKVEDGLVEAVIGLGRSAKDITINNGDTNATINYKYSLQPAWSSNDTKAPIYGAVSDIETEMKPIDGSHNIDAVVSNVSLGKVTPGLWKIHVIGYNNGQKVLEGRASAYFNGSDTGATVFVAPVSTAADVSVTITLYMQNLGSDDYNKIGYSFTNLNGTNISGSSVTSGKNPMTPSSGVASPENVKVYTREVTVKSGFNTVTFSLPGYNGGKGGITKTFLAIPGVPVTITGSVTPAEFKDGKAEIVVLNMNSGSIAVENKSDKDPSITTEIYNEGKDNEKTVTIYTLKSGVDYEFTYTPANDTNAISLASQGGYNLTRAYEWYVGGVGGDGQTGELENGSTYTFNESIPGDYNVTCVETITFTKDIEGEEVTHKLQASKTFEVVRVL